MARTVEVKIGGAVYVLRRSVNNMAAIERRFGTLDLRAVFEKPATFAERTSTMLDLLLCLTGGGGVIRPTAEALGDEMDPADTEYIIGKIGELFGGDPAARDPRSLAPFVPTPEPLIERMLDIAELKAGEMFLDPCCGDGRTLVAAAKRGAETMGCELDDGRFKTASSVASGVEQRDGFDAEFPDADVVFLYTLPDSNRKLQSRLLAECKETCRIVSHAFDMPGWPAYHTETFEGRTFYAWRISDVLAAQSDAAAAA